MQQAQVLILSEEHDIFQDLVGLLPEGATAMSHSPFVDLGDSVQLKDLALIVLVLPQQKTYQAIESLGRSWAAGVIPVIVVMHTPPSLSLVNALLPLHPLAILKYPFPAAQDRSRATQLFTHGLHVAERQSLKKNLAQVNERLNQRLQEINTLYTVGKSVIASLDSDEVLQRILGTALNLTRAEEGFILLKEEDKLYLRASKNMSEEFVQRFHREASDSIAWQVINSGRPAMLQRQTQIATGYLVRSLLYVPLQAPGRGEIGVLGVVNRKKSKAFTENQLFILSSIADFAAIALENARLFSAVAAEKFRLRAILEHAAEAILVTDAESRLLLWSHTAALLFDLPDEAVGHPLEEYIDNTGLLDLFAENGADEDQAGGEGEMSHAEVELEEDRIFNAQLTPIAEVGRVVIMQNITHLKELDRLKSEFVSTVSHDLRTPLTTVQGYIELLERVGPLTEMQQDFIQNALRSLRHITALISDLLDIGRIEAGYDLEMMPCRMDRVIKEAVETYLIPAEQAEIELSYDLPDYPLWVLGNARRLRQVIENLISNAIKYNEPKGWVRVRALRDNQHVIVRVEDNGLGIPLEEQPKIFERFYRVQAPETEDVHGTGLGLAIVRSVVQKHKGRIWLESAPGEGSTFAFVLNSYEDETEVPESL
ncbi:MAG: GAF domain-containing protein [Chloroflexi bacterium]|jgi:two-component system NtrC family sensor kinase|nr:GAF domain-containing protein [Chloroflexota bacterium]